MTAPSLHFESSSSSSSKKIILPPPHELGEYDVLCGRSKFSYNHVGNQRFRVTVSIFLEEYMDNPNRVYRSRLFERISKLMKTCGGRFWKLRGDGNEWVTLDESRSRQKISHALRDAAAFQVSKIPVTRTGKRLFFQEQLKVPNGRQKQARRQDSQPNFPAHPFTRTETDVSKSIGIHSSPTYSCQGFSANSPPAPTSLPEPVPFVFDAYRTELRGGINDKNTIQIGYASSTSNNLGVFDQIGGDGMYHIGLQDWDLVSDCLNPVTE